MKGFTLKEIFSIAAAAILILGVTLLVWWKSGLGPKISIYIGIPFGILPIFFGFKKFQGLTPVEYIKEIFYEKKTKILAYDADEISDKNPCFFTMEQNHGRKQ